MTGEQEAPASPTMAGDEAPGADGAEPAGALGATAGTTAAGAEGEPVEPACAISGVDGEGDARTAGLTEGVAEAPASMGLEVDTTGTSTTAAVL